jgi:hypothetical protein
VIRGPRNGCADEVVDDVNIQKCLVDRESIIEAPLPKIDLFERRNDPLSLLVGTERFPVLYLFYWT